MTPRTTLSPEWRKLAVELALRKAPQTAWQPEPVVDYSGQRLAQSSIERQLEGYVHDARQSIGRAPFEWASTGRWPRLRKAAAYFLRAGILSARSRYAAVPVVAASSVDFHSPPWSTTEAEWLHSEIFDHWFQRHAQAWLQAAVDDEFQQQEWMFQMYHPYE
jgi:hypothetical protein